ncbi:DNA repair protein XRCC3-like [Anopheles bellator]|uniref:DNA repair protein XRCC3-like n=1 Tax=Anopheles bellator TaxID=139047 RepID=UPI002647E14A|nr:DNA repair protein XRCC3-like [Anopheles bellator]
MLDDFEGFTSGNETMHKHSDRWGKLSFGVGVLDTLTGGGIPRRGIVELAGDPGAGKTQIALRLALNVQRQVEGSSVVYVATEHPFPSRRLLQMESEYKRLHHSDGAVQRHNFADHILVERVTNVPTLMACLFERLPRLLEKTVVSLLIIDSITSPFLDEEDYVERAETFRTMVHDLHRYQERHNMAILVTNQVRCVFDSWPLDNAQIVPALGLAWGSLVHTRIQLSRLTNTNNKQCTVVFGPTIRPAHGFFHINNSGPADVVNQSVGDD